MSDAKIDQTSIEIAAPARAVYDLVVDVTNMGRWSPETHRAEWVAPADGPAVGARFKGWNSASLKGLPLRWSTTSVIRQLDPGRAFSFDTPFSGTRWTYRFEPTEIGCQVTETREVIREPLPTRAMNAVVGDLRRSQLMEGMEVTLRRLKETAETLPADRG